MDLMASMNISASGMRAQSARMKITAENIANADAAIGPNGTEPYRPQRAVFQSALDKATGAHAVQLTNIQEENDATAFKESYDPEHPLANEKGIVLLPNIDTQLESLNMRESARAYEANMAAMESAKEMFARSLDLLR